MISFLFIISVKVTATSLKLELRLHAHQVGMDTRSGMEVSLCSSDWLMRLELGYFACSLISGFYDDAPTFIGQVLIHIA